MTADSPASGLPQEAVDAAWNARERHVAENGGAGQMEAALTAALPILREQWEGEVQADFNALAADCPHDEHLTALLAAERAKVAALRERTIQECIDTVQAAADDEGDRAKARRYRPALDALRAMQGATLAEFDMLARITADTESLPVESRRWLADRILALLPDVPADDRGTTTPTPATTCADCGTTRTICDAGLNTYDTRCCEQCGHGVT